MRKLRLSLIVPAAVLAPCAAQPAPDLRSILERLDRLEQENRLLREEVRALRETVTRGTPLPETPSLEERVAIHERRIDEHAQTKLEASQRFPIRVTGMVLFNAFVNSKQNGGSDNPTLASLARGGAAGGATLRQTVLGLDYNGPETFAGGKVRGSLFIDFFGGTSQPLNNLPRIRTAAVSIDWKTRSLTVGQDKPLIAPREPTSLAQVGVSPLTGAGNLWLWEPQVRFEQRFQAGDQSTLRAQLALVQTTENAAGVPAAFASTLERYRPGLEGRFEWSYAPGDGRRFEIAPGFHSSDTHVAATSVPSRVFTLDWLIAPWRPLEFTGAFFTGRNVAHFGTGGIRQGFSVLGARNVLPVHARGGWGQLNITATDRLSFHLMSGWHDDRNADLLSGGIARNHAVGANVFFRLAPNVTTSFEALQVRTTYLGPGTRLNNHYDLGIAYLF